MATKHFLEGWREGGEAQDGGRWGLKNANFYFAYLDQVWEGNTILLNFRVLISSSANWKKIAPYSHHYDIWWYHFDFKTEVHYYINIDQAAIQYWISFKQWPTNSTQTTSYWNVVIFSLEIFVHLKLLKWISLLLHKPLKRQVAHGNSKWKVKFRRFKRPFKR